MHCGKRVSRTTSNWSGASVPAFRAKGQNVGRSPRFRLFAHGSIAPWGPAPNASQQQEPLI
jgi:hypothetical protein